VGLFFSSVNGDAVIPRQFFEARVKAGDASNYITELISGSLKNVNQVGALESEDKISPALDLIHFEIENSRERQNTAVILAKNLEQMAQSTTSMAPDKAERLAVEAVSVGVAMVSQLVSYNDLLNDLLLIVQSKLNNGEALGTVQTAVIIEEMNNQAREINNLSKQFNKLIQTFDDKYID